MSYGISRIDILLRFSFNGSAKWVFTWRFLNRLHTAILLPDGGCAYICLRLRWDLRTHGHWHLRFAFRGAPTAWLSCSGLSLPLRWCLFLQRELLCAKYLELGLLARLVALFSAISASSTILARVTVWQGQRSSFLLRENSMLAIISGILSAHGYSHVPSCIQFILHKRNACQLRAWMDRWLVLSYQWLKLLVTVLDARSVASMYHVSIIVLVHLVLVDLAYDREASACLRYRWLQESVHLLRLALIKAWCARLLR